MQVLCKRTSGDAEFHCCVCGQGFVMFWERESQADRMEAKRELQEMLRRQHRMHRGPEAHPAGEFVVPSWRGTFTPATRGNPPVSDL